MHLGLSVGDLQEKTKPASGTAAMLRHPHLQVPGLNIGICSYHARTPTFAGARGLSPLDRQPSRARRLSTDTLLGKDVGSKPADARCSVIPALLPSRALVAYGLWMQLTRVSADGPDGVSFGKSDREQLSDPEAKAPLNALGRASATGPGRSWEEREVTRSAATAHVKEAP